MIKIKCLECGEEQYQTVHLYDPHIIVEQNMPACNAECTAVVHGRSICPCCGAVITSVFKSLIFNDDIKELATRKEQHAYAHPN